jgi:hypothetical protein
MQDEIASGGKRGYIGSQPIGKTDIPVKHTSLESAAIDVLPHEMRARLAE